MEVITSLTKAYQKAEEEFVSFTQHQLFDITLEDTIIHLFDILDSEWTV